MTVIDDSGHISKGLVNALLLDGKGGAKKIDQNEVVNLNTQQDKLWLHFDYEEPAVQQWLEQCSGLNTVAIESLISDETRPHVLSRGDNLLIVLRGVNQNPGAQPEDMVSLRIWTDGKRLISTRKRSLISTETLLSSLSESSGAEDIAALLIEWVDRIVASISDVVDDLEEELLDMEEQLFSAEPRELRSELLHMRKKAILIRRYLAPQREALNQLIAAPLTWLNDFHRVRLRSIADRQIRHIEDIDTVKERASMAQEELANRVSEQLNSRSYVLTVVAAVFLPLGFFTGLMGINVGGMPGVESEQGFWLVSAICMGLTVLLMGLFYWRKWL
ncbi:zinc transporter ZntB [Oceanicoccus sagamiensis]|uniref:Zinc transporter ZntB n=1 Tax=Oceanicoccus sagamiensis TaxID=716816 RepID=A0A1X9NCY1_9GAMM|nr:zinc transporter ZntB [Oceanicoccus sagamiensis]ARN75898.1 zinc transporter ZntB [Oceanicoccus sagamiensis]